MKGKGGNVDVADIQEVLEREGQLGERPVDLYTRPPFSTITQLMDKAGLSTTDVQVFLRWKAKHDNLTKARKVKLKPKKMKNAAKKWLNGRKKRSPVGEL